jgi:hypothetical protein
MKMSFLLALVLTVGLGAVVAEVEQSKVLWIAETDSGKVWANVSLTRQRTEESYVPVAIGIQNKQKEHVRMTREGAWLTDPSGLIYTMPSVKDLRKGYDRLGIDQRLVSFGGIPWEVWVGGRRFASSNFFPHVRSTRGNTTNDSITLRQGFAMADLLYFEKPREFAPGKPFFLVVAPVGWEHPIRVQIVLS